jgi:hypothetical protein
MFHSFRQWLIFSLFIWRTFFCLGGECESSTLYLTWQRSPETTMTIQWLSQVDQANGLNVMYQSAQETDWHTAPPPSLHLLFSPYFLYRTELVDLQPNTLYRFKIEPEGNIYHFKTMPTDNASPIRFVVGGDMYHDDLSTLVPTSQEAAKTDPDFALVGGDIAYAFGKSGTPQKTERWIAWVRAWHTYMKTADGKLIPVIAAIGNHDLQGQFDQGPLQAYVFSTLFPMPGERIFNVLDFGNYLSVFILDSGHAHSVNGSQKDWLKTVLNERFNRPHKFAIYHVPAYPSVRPFNQAQSVILRKNWVPLFEKYGLHAAFEHHDHAYKRTYPLRNNKVHPQGVLYIGDGAWGVNEPRKASTNKRMFYLAKTAPTRHFILVTLEENKRQFTVISDEGHVIDQFSSGS